MDQTFLYEVRPRKIITGIHGVAYIRSPRSLYLTKEEVLVCLQHGSVYRRFANLDKLERVTVTNVDRLHNENFIPEDQWTGKVEEVVTAPVVEEPTPAPVVEEKVEEAPVVAEEDAQPEVVEEAEEVTSDEVVEAPVEEAEAAEEEEDDSEEEEVVEAAPQQNNNNVQFKSHHNKKHKK